MDKKNIQLKAEYKVVKNSAKKLNSQFMLVDILVAYTGDNRNYSSISKKAFEDAMPSLYGIPLVAERVIEEDDQSKETWGSHGGKIVIDDSGIKYEQTTRPYGFVTNDAVDSAKWVTVTEKDGHTKHEYLKIKGCILWYKRYEECMDLMEENANQSMEIDLLDYSHREDGYIDIHKFEYSALCIIGCEPCFESASIGRHYAFDEFKKEFQLMLDEYKKSQESNKEENHKMKEKIVEILSAFKFTNTVGKEAFKYEILDIRDDTVDVIDREADYKLYSIPYSKNEVDEVLIEYDKKQEKSITVGEKSEVGFSIKTELADVTADMVAFAISTHESNVISELNKKYTKLETDYNSLKADSDKDKAVLVQYAKAKTDAEFELHKTEINKKIEEYQDKMGSFSEYLIYRTKVDYSKTIDQTDVDMLILLGKFNKEKPTSFSYFPQETGVNEEKSSTGNSRYGNLFDKIQK